MLKNLADALAIKAYITTERCRKALIVGAGFIAMEMAEALRNIGLDTKIVHRGSLPASRWDPEFSKLIAEELERNQAPFLKNVKALAVENGRESRLRLITDQGEMEADLILLALGVRPNVKCASDMGIVIGDTGAIKVDAAQATSMEGVYAVGDCCEAFHRVSRRWVNMPLGDVANKQGRVAGRNIGGAPSAFRGIVGSQSFKVFGLEVAATGLDEKAAAESGYRPATALVWGNAVAASMPAAKKLGIKLVADRATGKLLGAQAVGEAGAVSRINTLAAVLWSEMGLDDVAFLDLAYSPPFGGSWDLIHIAAQVLTKQL
ncbi:MAG: FAD-dependent oxidoreductase [Deltaproteobacteria bacterium]|nr:FAD-dependent oxidoreductase [Deltaproteobacteria bacterium]